MAIPSAAIQGKPTPPSGPLPGLAADSIPETRRYRLKNKLLGPPLVTEQLASERLNKVIALGVLAPDCISSSAYGTEEMLTQLVPYVGLAAFALVVPITLAILGVLFFVTLSYLEVIQLYTKAGGSYVVARDNFGPRIAQIAAVALLIDYTVTVAVQTSAGTAALTSAVPSLTRFTVEITVAVVLLLLFGNLRGIREAGSYFAVPTYFFILSLVSVIVFGFIKEALGTLHTIPLPPASQVYGGKIGTPGDGWLMGLAFIFLLRSFANGGSSLTGLEAISNGVSSFRRPEAKNARQTLVAMSSTLAFLVLGVTLLARWTHAVPYAGGTPTVVSQEVRAVFGTSAVGHLLFYVVQLATMLILYTGGNTSFNGFPYLASFVAGDRFLPRQLTRRGHRLAFSNGILVLAGVALALVLVYKAQVNDLVSLYAIGVFTGFFMAGSGMVKHHLTARVGHWKRSIVINGFSAFLSFTVVLIFAVAKFKEGAWLIFVVGPLLYIGLIRLHHQYETEAEMLETGVSEATEEPVLRRHVVVVFVDRLDMAVVRALQYARTLSPDDLRAVHFDIDTKAAHELEAEWGRFGLGRLPLDIIEVPDRRLRRAAIELVADATLDGDTECTVLLPRRSYRRVWQRFLHDRTADKIAAVLGQVPHVSATIVPFAVAGQFGERVRSYGRSVQRARLGLTGDASGPVDAEGRAGVDRLGRRDGPKRPATVLAADQTLARRAGATTPIASVVPRQRIRVAGRVKSVRVQPRAGTSNLECVLSDGTGGLLLVFQGRPKIAGIEPGARLVAEGMVGAWGRRPAMLNPSFELVQGAPSDPAEG
ncbi:MAG TPA: amino acid permease [Acidimicrobiales bacterium]